MRRIIHCPMRRIIHCPIVGDRCNKNESEIRVLADTFFLGEPFKPKKDRKRRENVIKIALKNALKRKYSETSLRVADKDPKEAIFCDICRLIQSSSYGIFDISGLNPNVLIELGMALVLGKPVSILVKKSGEEKLRKKLPSDIIWMRAIIYEEFIDMVKELGKHISNRPILKMSSTADEFINLLSDINPDFAKDIEAKLNNLPEVKGQLSNNLKTLLKDTKIGDLPQDGVEIKLSSTLEKKINDISRKIEQIEKLVGFPEKPDIAFLRGNWYLHRKEYENALGLYDWVIVLKPNHIMAWFRRGFVLAKLGKYEDSIKAYEKVIEIQPVFKEAWGNKGAALGHLGKREEAIKCFDKVLEIKPDDEKALFNKGVALGELGKYEEAIKCYDKALEIKPDDEKAWGNKGVALGHLGKREEAIKCFDKALEIKPDYEKIKINRNLVLEKIKNKISMD